MNNNILTVRGIIDSSNAIAFLKRSPASGYASEENPQFYKDSNTMLLNQAKSSVNALLCSVHDYFK